jgi:hypothetical protein
MAEKKDTLWDGVHAVLADGSAMAKRTVAYKLNCEVHSLNRYLFRGMLVIVGREKPQGPYQRTGAPIVALSEFAEKYGVRAPIRRPPRSGKRSVASSR